MAINRVEMGPIQHPAGIQGQINANGNAVLINNNGVVFEKAVDVKVDNVRAQANPKDKNAVIVPNKAKNKAI